MKAKIAIEINVPEGATHYCGNLLDDPTWYKTEILTGVPYWLYWSNQHNEWMIKGETKPHWVIDIPFIESTEKDASRYQYLKSVARQEGRDGGYVQVYTLPIFLKSAPHYATHASLDECIDAEIVKAGK